MNSKKQKKNQESKKTESKRTTKNKALSVVGALTLSATLPIAIPGANATVAERINRIREAFTKTTATQGLSAHASPPSDLVKAESDREETSQFGNFSNFADFNNFSNFQDAFNNWSNFSNKLP